MLLRDPVHGLIEFVEEEERLVLALLDCREVQRLRRIRQLGLTSLVFPGAEHSRFAHAVGAAHVMSRFLNRVREVQDLLPKELRLDAEGAADALAGALLHDLGHGPFSHLFEQVQEGSRHHEDWTIDTIRDPGTEVHAALEAYSAGMSERVARMLRGEHRLPYLADAVSGMLDVDRADYLLRDSHMTGVRYGLYDLDWLLRALTFAELNGRWIVAIHGRKGLPPIESFFLGRHYMYHQVYHHKATRGAEVLIRGLFQRLGELVRDGIDVPVPQALRDAALGRTVSLGDYLALDDPEILSSVAQWRKSPDPILASLADQLLARRLPKTLPLDEVDESKWEGVRELAANVVASKGARADLLVWLDVASDTPYDEEKSHHSMGTWVKLQHHPLQRLGDASFLLGELRGKTIRRPRLIFPPSARDDVVSALSPILDGVPNEGE